MKIEELEPYLQSLRNWLLNNDFTLNPTLRLMESYEKSITSLRELSIIIDFGNQYVYVRDNSDNTIVTIYNSDINGNLTIEYLEQLIKTIYWNEKSN